MVLHILKSPLLKISYFIKVYIYHYLTLFIKLEDPYNQFLSYNGSEKIQIFSLNHNFDIFLRTHDKGVKIRVTKNVLKFLQ